MTLEERASRREGMIEEIRSRLDDMNARMTSLEARMNMQLSITIAMWVTTMLAVLSTLAAVLLRT